MEETGEADHLTRSDKKERARMDFQREPFALVPRWKEISQEQLVENEGLNTNLDEYKRIVNKKYVKMQKR